MKDVLVGDDEGNYKRTYIKYMQSKEYNSREEDGSRPVFNVSKKGKNVIFITVENLNHTLKEGAKDEVLEN